jgi:hypothetical protein
MAKENTKVSRGQKAATSAYSMGPKAGSSGRSGRIDGWIAPTAPPALQTCHFASPGPASLFRVRQLFQADADVGHLDAFSVDSTIVDAILVGGIDGPPRAPA